MADAKITKIPASGVSGTSEIDFGTDDAVLWKANDIEMFELDTTDGSGYVAISADTDTSNGKPYLRLNESTNYVELAANGYARLYGAANDLYAYASNKFEMLQSSDGQTSWRIRIVDLDPDYDLLVIDGDASNFTYTFHTDDSGVFKVTDNAGSPVTYLSLTEGGACAMGHTGSTTTLEGSGTTIRGVSWVRARVNGNPVWSGERSGSATFVQHNGGNVTNCETTYGATTQHTANTSVGDHVLMINHVFELAASGPSGAVTCDADFKHQSGVPTGANGYASVSHVTIVNSNASHNYIFKYNLKSGNGSVAPFDSDATNLTDGTGYTCAPGKVAMFEIRTVRVGGTAITNQVHMVRCLGKS